MSSEEWSMTNPVWSDIILSELSSLTTQKISQNVYKKQVHFAEEKKDRREQCVLPITNHTNE